MFPLNGVFKVAACLQRALSMQIARHGPPPPPPFALLRTLLQPLLAPAATFLFSQSLEKGTLGRPQTALSRRDGGVDAARLPAPQAVSWPPPPPIQTPCQVWPFFPWHLCGRFAPLLAVDCSMGRTLKSSASGPFI